ncbi:hypothetical protein CAPTEDRAFT_204580 [Capitella teleta]|uniref:C-type lectin domain-containing protein n=1 Tax=Capitella teleta TaxID=283909 RepID=R7V7R8_CAPTE|nr:hypothetical protein CAPTEDRAFT_204580 [Capitella teleta]|eukprot:ELU14903.1 hypothetical protein CAPTEDRAFT_204580 [Capitella teleta]
MQAFVFLIIVGTSIAQEQRECCTAATAIVREFNRLHQQSFDRVTQNMDQHVQVLETQNLALKNQINNMERLIAQTETHLLAEISERTSEMQSALDQLTRREADNRRQQILANARSRYRIWWTAGNDRDNEGVWEWADVDRPFSSIPGRWYDGEPNDAEGGEDCAHVYLHEGGTLNDRSCNEAGGFICEFELTD